MKSSQKVLWRTLPLFLLFAITLRGFTHRPPILQADQIAPSASIPYSSEYNYRQTINDCAPFNAAAVVRALTGKEVSSAEFAQEIGWRLPNKYTLPWGLEKQLKENGITVELPKAHRLSDEEKLDYLRQELSQGRPIILLGERDGYEHYVTLLGFDTHSDVFYLYDSFYDKLEEGMTIDSNGDLPGNRNYTSQELLEFWKGSGMYGLYRWYTLVASKITSDL